jgi:malonyl CoA-acyl carrier protein transacylase
VVRPLRRTKQQADQNKKSKQNRTAVYVPAIRLVIGIVAVQTCRAYTGLGLCGVAVRRQSVAGHVTCSAKKQ